MPFLNFDSRHFSSEEKTAIQDALLALETALQPKLANLNAQERQQYGSVNEQNKLIINKVKDYRDTQPNLSSPDVDWVEYMKDHDSRAFLQNQAERITELIRGMENAKILHDWDNYQASLVDYSYTQYKDNSGATGYSTKHQELKQFFNRTGASTTPATPTENPKDEV